MNSNRLKNLGLKRRRSRKCSDPFQTKNIKNQPDNNTYKGPHIKHHYWWALLSAYSCLCSGCRCFCEPGCCCYPCPCRNPWKIFLYFCRSFYTFCRSFYTSSSKPVHEKIEFQAFIIYDIRILKPWTVVQWLLKAFFLTCFFEN